jgi:hypothetical protein
MLKRKEKNSTPGKINYLPYSISTGDPQLVAGNTHTGYGWGSPAASADQKFQTLTPVLHDIRY